MIDHGTTHTGFLLAGSPAIPRMHDMEVALLAGTETLGSVPSQEFIEHAMGGLTLTLDAGLFLEGSRQSFMGLVQGLARLDDLLVRGLAPIVPSRLKVKQLLVDGITNLASQSQQVAEFRDGIRGVHFDLTSLDLAFLVSGHRIILAHLLGNSTRRRQEVSRDLVGKDIHGGQGPRQCSFRTGGHRVGGFGILRNESNVHRFERLYDRRSHCSSIKSV